MRSLINMKIAPVNIEPGIKTLWSAVWNKSREICGTTIPMKPIGPQNAVTPPARMLVLTKAMLLATLELTPSECAYS